MNSEKLSFNNTKKAFLSKNNSELNESYWLFRLMGNPFVVKIGSKLTLFALSLRLPVQGLIKRTIFKQFCGGESLKESQSVVKRLSKSHIGSILDYSVEGKSTEEDFEKTKTEVIDIIALAKGNKAIPYTSLKMSGIVRLGLLETINSLPFVPEDCQSEYKLLHSRLTEVCQASVANEVPIYIDAEESWIQGAIDQLAEEMMSHYNKEKAFIQTTLQMYRKGRIDYLKNLIQQARIKKYFIGVKLVRGAYLEKETARADRLGLTTPIQQNKEDTDREFDEAVLICLQNLDVVTLCAGTHNEASTFYLVKEMKNLNIAKDDSRIYFSQLFGMSDNITYNLADEGYNVTKYLPYGPIGAVLPYLIRRANENTAIAGQMGRELNLIARERKRRVGQHLLSSSSITPQT
jgi:proline dehydrogenase